MSVYWPKRSIPKITVINLEHSGNCLVASGHRSTSQRAPGEAARCRPVPLKRQRTGEGPASLPSDGRPQEQQRQRGHNRQQPEREEEKELELELELELEDQEDQEPELEDQEEQEGRGREPELEQERDEGGEREREEADATAAQGMNDDEHVRALWDGE